MRRPVYSLLPSDRYQNASSYFLKSDGFGFRTYWKVYSPLFAMALPTESVPIGPGNILKLLIHFAHVGLFHNFGDVKDRGLSEELSRVPCPVQERRGLSGLYYQVTVAQRL